MPIPESEFKPEVAEMIRRMVPSFTQQEPMSEEERAARMAEVKVNAEEEEKQRELSALRRLGIPPRYYESLVENWIADSKEKKDALLQVVNNIWKENLFITGNAGTGKTHLAYGFVKRGATYRRLPDIFREVRQDFDSENDVLDFLGRVKLLIIDEIGRTKFSDFERNLFFEIVDRRYNNMVPMTLITNLTENEFAEQYGTAVMDRLRPILVKFNWKSRRK
ncbi:DNA replication protein DnaC [Spirochaetia bacterium]|nr:DNA replication protein DnaC [Spirochaetia bacterium]